MFIKQLNFKYIFENTYNSYSGNFSVQNSFADIELLS